MKFVKQATELQYAQVRFLQKVRASLMGNVTHGNSSEFVTIFGSTDFEGISIAHCQIHTLSDTDRQAKFTRIAAVQTTGIQSVQIPTLKRARSPGCLTFQNSYRSGFEDRE